MKSKLSLIILIITTATSMYAQANHIPPAHIIMISKEAAIPKTPHSFCTLSNDTHPQPESAFVTMIGDFDLAKLEQPELQCLAEYIMQASKNYEGQPAYYTFVKILETIVEEQEEHDDKEGVIASASPEFAHAHTSAHIIFDSNLNNTEDR